MRALSKQRLSRMHAMLDKQLQNEEQTISNPSFVSQGRKQRGNFNHLRYTCNINLDDDNDLKDSRPKQSNSSKQRQSQQTRKQPPSSSLTFKKSLQKENTRQGLHFNTQSQKDYGALSSSEDELQKQSKGSMRGSRKNEINQLEKKLFDLEKKMENIQLSSSGEEDQDEEDYQRGRGKVQKNVIVQRTNALMKNDSKKSFNLPKLQENNTQPPITTNNHAHYTDTSPNEGTARFSNSGNPRTNDQNPKRQKQKQKAEFRSNLPLSHRQNTPSQEEDSPQNNDDQFQYKYDKFVKITRGNNASSESGYKALNQKVQKDNRRDKKEEESEEEEDSSEQQQLKERINDRTQLHNKSISEQIERLSIMNKQSASINKPANSINGIGSKSSLTRKTPTIITQNPSNIKSQSKEHKIKINTIPTQPDRKTTVQHEALQPKYEIQSIKKNSLKSKEKSKSKKSIGLPKKSLSKEKVVSVKGTNRSEKEQSGSKRKIERNFTNLDNSFRSDNSAKSKKSINSLRSVGSNKSLSRKQLTQQARAENLEQKKYTKKIQNLQKQLQHYKRLSKRYETQISDYKYMEIQYRKLQSQFKKSQQIRVEQKKIIENFKSRMTSG